MNYPDGSEAHVGDRITYIDGSIGVVVCSMDNDEYSERHPKAQWGYLKKGIMVYTSFGGLVHYEETEQDIVHVERADTSRSLEHEEEMVKANKGWHSS